MCFESPGWSPYRHPTEQTPFWRSRSKEATTQYEADRHCDQSVGKERQRGAHHTHPKNTHSRTCWYCPEREKERAREPFKYHTHRTIMHDDDGCTAILLIYWVSSRVVLVQQSDWWLYCGWSSAEIVTNRGSVPCGRLSCEEEFWVFPASVVSVVCSWLN